MTESELESHPFRSMRRFSKSFILYRTWHAGLLTARTWTRRAVQLSTQINIVLLPRPDEQRNTCFFKEEGARMGGVALELESVYPVSRASAGIDSTAITAVIRHHRWERETCPHCRLERPWGRPCVWVNPTHHVCFLLHKINKKPRSNYTLNEESKVISEKVTVF